jgi:protein disulfide-isomerase-like protein
MRVSHFSFFALAAGACDKSDFYGKTAVADLCDSHFPDKKSENIWMVEFYAPWCGHCKALKPKYIEAAKTAKKNQKFEGIKFGAVDCTKEQHLCQKYSVQGYPTIKAFVGGKAKEYPGAREADAMLDFMMSLKNSKGSKGGSAKCSSSLVDAKKTEVVPLCASHFPDKKGKHSWVVVFHSEDAEKSEQKSLYKLADKLQKLGVKLGAVDCKDKEFCESKLGETIKKFTVKTYAKGDKSSDKSVAVDSLSDASAVVKFAKEQLNLDDHDEL